MTGAPPAFPPPREIEALRALALDLLNVADHAVASGDRPTIHLALVTVRSGLSEARQRAGAAVQACEGSAEPEGRHAVAIVAGLLAPAVEAERLLVGAAMARRPVRKGETPHALPLRHLP